MFRNRLKNKKVWQRLFITLFITVILIMGLFLRWRNREFARLQAGSQLIETTHGLIEYTTFGQGAAVLVLHGTIGGYDQAQTLAEMLGSDAYQFIAVSRPGYLRTPLETGPSFAEQADAYAALLDELDIEQAAVMAISGGGPPAVQFALRHPERTWGLVMIATSSDVEARHPDEDNAAQRESSPPPTWLLNFVFSDFVGWLFTSGAKWQPSWFLPPLVGESYEEAVLNDPVKYHLYTGFVDSFSLPSQRRVGSFNDGQRFLTFTGYPYETILTPMLILQGTEDSPLLALEQRHLHEAAPHSEFLTIEGGTHFMPISHNEILAPLILDFLAENRPFPG